MAEDRRIRDRARVRSGSAAGDKGENVRMNRRRLIALLAGAVAVAACAPRGPTGEVTSALPVRAAPAARARVVLIVMENKEQGRVLGSRSAAFLNRLAGPGGVETPSF